MSHRKNTHNLRSQPKEFDLEIFIKKIRQRPLLKSQSLPHLFF